MQTIFSLDAFLAEKSGERHAVTIGNFDGVHAGHRELIRITREKAAARKVRSLLITFDPHPAHIVRGGATPQILTPLPRKLALLAQTGIDTTLVLPFTKTMAATPAEEFVRTVLVNGVAATDIVTGFNFALGRGRTGNFSSLTSLGEQWDFTVTQVPPVVVNGETASSSGIREHLTAGDVDKATMFLKRAHSVDGTVIHGEARGRKLGFPTANIDFGETLLPALGGYATWLRVLCPEKPESGNVYMGMTSVGTNPTFGKNALTLETHLLDYSGDLYKKQVRLYFITRLRGQIRFSSPEELVQHLRLDAKNARETLEKSELPTDFHKKD